MKIYEMPYREALNKFAVNHKNLAIHVISNLDISGRKAFEETLDWSMAGKFPHYVTIVREYRAQHGRAPSKIRFAYVNGDIHIVSKSGEIIV